MGLITASIKFTYLNLYISPYVCFSLLPHPSKLYTLFSRALNLLIFRALVRTVNNVHCAGHSGHEETDRGPPRTRHQEIMQYNIQSDTVCPRSLDPFKIQVTI